MQCKDIPDLPVLQFLAKLGNQEIVSTYGEPGKIVEWRPIAGCVWGGVEHSVQHAMPPEVAGKEKLVRAKMGLLIRRGLVDGCTCGCRGDFELTSKGRAVLQLSNAGVTPASTPRTAPTPPTAP